MKIKFLFLWICWLIIFPQIVRAENESKTCRLANTYYMNGTPYSSSEGILVEGKYPTASDRDECYQICREEEQWRTEDLPDIFTLGVTCYYGDKVIYSKTLENIGQ